MLADSAGLECGRKAYLYPVVVKGMHPGAQIRPIPDRLVVVPEMRSWKGDFEEVIPCGLVSTPQFVLRSQDLRMKSVVVWTFPALITRCS